MQNFEMRTVTSSCFDIPRKRATTKLSQLHKTPLPPLFHSQTDDAERKLSAFNPPSAGGKIEHGKTISPHKNYSGRAIQITPTVNIAKRDALDVLYCASAQLATVGLNHLIRCLASTIKNYDYRLMPDMDFLKANKILKGCTGSAS
jgi:hypothetical protein